MAQVDVAPSFGAELKDGYKPVNAWVSLGIAWLDDVQSFYRERSAIEKEYAGKLNALAKKYFEKKAKKASGLGVGETPVVTPGSLESASMSTWTTQLTTLEQRAAEHDKFAAQLIQNLAEPLKTLATRTEELRKLHSDYSGKLDKERESVYGDLRKMKGKYDSACQEVENRRKKVDSSFDMNKSKSQLTYQQQLVDMHNIKNTYIIGLNVTNKQKERYFYEYVPELLDSLQDLNETRVAKLNSVWTLAAQLESQTLMQSNEYANHLISEIARNKPVLDSMMFARHNAANWSEPANVQFEPSPVWLDEGVLVTDEAAKNFLRNVLTKSKETVSQLKKEEDSKRREVEGAKKVRQKIRDGQDKREEIEIVRALFDLQTSLHDVERKKITAEVEMSTITSVVGDVSIGAQSHNFKSETFKIPTNCDHCGDRIWGLSAKGSICKDCGFTCHSKCVMKIPAQCPGEQTKEEKKKLKQERQEAAHAANGVNGLQDSLGEMPTISRNDTMNTLSSGYSTNARRSVSGTSLPSTAPTDDEPSETPRIKPTIPGARRTRMIAPPPSQYAPDIDSSDVGSSSLLTPSSSTFEKRGRMVYAYQPNGDGEISVDEGRDVIILEADDGSGWMKIRCSGEDGLVPASYVEALPNTPSLSSTNRPASTYSNNSTASLSASATLAPAAIKKKGPAVAPKRGAKKLKYVQAIYDYEARTDAEHHMHEGERFVLINKTAGEGWAEVEKGGVVKSVPANYIQDA